MGSCGCGDFNGEFKLKGADGNWYVFERYLGCEYCNTGLALRVYRLTPEDAEQWGIKDIPDLPIIEYTPNKVNGETWIKFLDPVILKDKIIRSFPVLSGLVDDQDLTSITREASFSTIKDK